MKDDKHTIDNLFKDRLYNVESDVESSSWNNISKKIQTKPVYTVNKWFYGIGLTVAAAAAGYFYTENNIRTIQVASSKDSSVSIAPAIVKPDSVQTIYKKENVHIKNTSAHDVLPEVPVEEEIFTLDERKTIQLPDGSEVILNRNSRISYSIHFLTDRTIYVSGEVYVKVAPSKGKKLTVISNWSRIEVVESSFIIKSDKSLTYDQIFVSTGKVDCKSLLANEDRIAIFAGNNAVIHKGGELKQNSILDINYNDWVTEKIVFNNTALNTVFETLEKYYNVTLKADNSEIMNCHFTGTFERNNINEILQVLSVSFNLSFNQNSNEYILSGKGCK